MTFLTFGEIFVRTLSTTGLQLRLIFWSSLFLSLQQELIFILEESDHHFQPLIFPGKFLHRRWRLTELFLSLENLFVFLLQFPHILTELTVVSPVAEKNCSNFQFKVKFNLQGFRAFIIYQDLYQSTFYVVEEFVELFQFNLSLFTQQSVGIVFIYQLPASLERKLYLLLSVFIRCLDTWGQVLSCAGLRELSRLQTVFMAGKTSSRCLVWARICYTCICCPSREWHVWSWGGGAGRSLPRACCCTCRLDMTDS